MRTVGMGVKKEDPDAKLRAELEELKKSGEEKAEQTGRKKSQ